MKSDFKSLTVRLKEVDSTNLYCKRYPLIEAGRQVVVVAERQTGGMGTKGRSFSSEKGGLYISVMRRFPLPFSETFSIMINSCVAVCRTLERIGLRPTIKWANDVLCGGKKICGTLIENTLLSDGTLLSIVGMGINVNNRLPEELAPVATSVCQCKGRRYPIDRIRRILIKNLRGEYTVEDYKSYIDWFGKEVCLTCGEKTFSAIAADVGKDGSLICEADGKRIKINSAEMSLRLICSTT